MTAPRHNVDFSATSESLLTGTVPRDQDRLLFARCGMVRTVVQHLLS